MYTVQLTKSQLFGKCNKVLGFRVRNHTHLVDFSVHLFLVFGGRYTIGKLRFEQHVQNGLHIAIVLITRFSKTFQFCRNYAGNT